MNQPLLPNHINESLFHCHQYDQVQDKDNKILASSTDIYSTSIIPNHHITEDNTSDSGSVFSSDDSMNSIADTPVETDVSIAGAFLPESVNNPDSLTHIRIVVVVAFANNGITLSLGESIKLQHTNNR